MDLAPNMYPGWNLGNTLEAVGGETGWQHTVTSKAVIDYVKAQGFKSVRIPTAWRIHADATGKIDQAWMTRVKEIVNYCIDDGLYVVLNDHWDNGWIEVDGFSKSHDSYQPLAELNRDLNTLRTYKRFRFVSDVIDQHGTLTDSSRMLYILIEVFKSWNFNSVST